MNRSITKILTLTVISVVLTACGVQQVNDKLDKLPRMKTNDLVDVLDSISLLKPEHFYSKISTDFSDGHVSYSFKTSLRVRRDSAINAFITYANIPMITAMITPDTLTIVNRREKCYIQENMEYLKSILGVEFKQRNLEEIFLGQPIDWNKDEKYFQIHDPYNYIISSHKKRQIKKADKKDDYDEIILLYYLDNKAQNLNKIVIENPIDTTHIEVNYKKRQMVDSLNVPELVDVLITTPRDTINIAMDYNKTKVNQRKKLYLAIPDDYEECQ
ncbi:DUF4292 domain-containing protein [Lishizhenia sp.]|uniref:DUF4292 domain-containing protein n=1 Tax=Lishizhenia sp. TaxID=2497594 RepID=UPI00299D71FB|nr:DUF4292 domain-containing protein [Lishizhenia sp.]MDX1445452.1 DUF4292 domain-containing protein [Lishizhenia sp.]